MDDIQGFHILPLNLFNSPFRKFLYVIPFDEKVQSNPDVKKNNETQTNGSNSKTRSLLVANLTYDCTEEDIKEIFSSFGIIESVLFGSIQHHIPLKHRGNKDYIPTYEPFFYGGFAKIIFDSEDVVSKVMSSSHKQVTGKKEAGDIKGIAKWEEQYIESTNYDTKRLEYYLNELMSDYDRRILEQKKKEEEEAQNQQDGWSVVKKGRGGKLRAFGNESKQKGKDKDKNLMLHLYDFQRQKSKMDNITKLQKQFAKDTKKMKRMQERRSFNPY
eukprot:TRINITY_DN11589_c0_g1_i1.p1 TRINITY_DN11589_c0_g1~~TRINITY_DN11589_c0_g1_i1.p1  ORF type:complete len:272 (-),score=49.03 TRINITY_DN11589_c0_g1_i1:13-828(-)